MTVAVPTFKYRLGQREAIDGILEAWDSGYSTVLLDAPTGSGKTLVASHLARRSWDVHGWSGYFSSPLTTLVSQVEKDPLVGPHIATVMGRRNYDCDWLINGPNAPAWPYKPPHTAEDAPCVVGMVCPRCRGSGYDLETQKTCPKKIRGAQWCPSFCKKGCEYYRRKELASASEFSGMTLSYLLQVTRDLDDENAPFQQRDFLFIDEAHNLERAGIQELAFQLSPKSIDGQGWPELWENDIRPRFDGMEYLEQQDVLMLMDKVLSPLIMAKEVAKERFTEDIGDRSNYREYKRLVNLTGKVNHILANPSSEWLMVPKVPQTAKRPEYVEVGPVTSREFLSSHLWPLAPRRVLSSGTFGDIDEYLGEVGLPMDSVKIVKVPSSFPPRNGPIFLDNVAHLSHRTMDENIPKILDRIREILNKESDRGIIHINSYKLAKTIRGALEDDYGDRLVGHASEDRNESLDTWLDSGIPGLVFIAVAMTDGLDLHDELARWQIIVKCPWPDISDPRVVRRRRMPDGDRWYRAVTSRQLWQAVGRVVRCFSTDTEILTTNGWKSYAQVKVGDTAYGVDLHTFDVKPGVSRPIRQGAPVLRLNPIRAINRPMRPESTIHIQTHGCDILVTPDHTMLTTPERRKDQQSRYTFLEKGKYPRVSYHTLRSIGLHKIRADSLPSKTAIPLAGRLVGLGGSRSGCKLSSDWFWLMGMILADGSIDKKYNGITIVQSDAPAKRQILDHIEKTLVRLKLDFTKTKSSTKGNQIVIGSPLPYYANGNMVRFDMRGFSSARVRDIFDGGRRRRYPKPTQSRPKRYHKKLHYGYSQELKTKVIVEGWKDVKKEVPRWVFERASQVQMKAFIMGMMDGDGHWGKRGHVGCYYTKEKHLADAFQELCVLTGYRTMTSIKEGCYQIQMVHRGSVSIIKATAVSDGPITKVWCVNTELGSVVMRRNGSTFIAGNSATDVGRTYVLDSSACDLMLETSPEWALYRIAEGKKQAPRRARPWE